MSAQRSGTQNADSAGFRFGSERHALRSEDAPLVTGRGKFTDDLDMSGQVHAAFVRATVAHAIIRKVDVARALRMPGVVAVITGRDLAADNIGGIPPVASFNGRDGNPMFQARMPVLAAERVRYVGEAVAIVIAETAYQAQDAAEAVEVRTRSTCRCVRRGARDGEGCAGDLAGRAGQHRARLGRWRCRGGRRRICPSRAHRAGEADRYASRAERDGAAGRDRELRCATLSAIR